MRRFIGVCLLITLANVLSPTFASERLPSCYTETYLGELERSTTRTLYLFVDQTMPLTATMKNSISDLVSDWGSDGERIKIARFSANISGNYTELMFDEFADPPATREFLFNLREADKSKLIACLKSRGQKFHKRLNHAVGKTLHLTNAKLPKSDLLSSLKELATKVIESDTSVDRTVLLVSDGLENSDFGSFYQRRTVLRPLDPRKTIEEANKQNLIPDWKGAKVYMYGVGFVANEKIYVRPKLLAPLVEFWRAYFTLGKARLMELGTPELLVSTLK